MDKKANKETIKAMESAKAGIDLSLYDSLEDLKAEFENE